MNNEKDQWLLDGDCRICRRQNYCKKPCKRAKNAVETAISELISEKMVGFDAIKSMINQNRR